MLVAFDTNILVYAEFEPDYAKGILAKRLVGALAQRGVLAAQVIGELFNVARRRWPERWVQVREQVEIYRSVLEVVPTGIDVLIAASMSAQRYRLQFWDAVIWEASRRGGAAILLTEDMQDGFAMSGMRALNPFSRPDWLTLAADLGIEPHR
jgi:predicted nucleic acid-binding protein